MKRKRTISFSCKRDDRVDIIFVVDCINESAKKNSVDAIDVNVTAQNGTEGIINVSIIAEGLSNGIMRFERELKDGLDIMPA